MEPPLYLAEKNFLNRSHAKKKKPINMGLNHFANDFLSGDSHTHVCGECLSFIRLLSPNFEFSILENTIALTTRNLQSLIHLHSLICQFLHRCPLARLLHARSVDLPSSPHSQTRILLPSLLRGVPLGPESRYPVVFLAVLCVLSGDAADEGIGWKGVKGRS